MNPIPFVVGYVVLTVLLWFGNRSVGIKRPMASAAKWFVWTAAWFSFSAMMIDTDASRLTVENVVMPLAISVFVYPMLLFKSPPSIGTLGLVLLWVGPLAASAFGYVLATRHNIWRSTNPVVKKDPRAARRA